MSRRTSRAELSASILEEASAWLIEFNDGELDTTQRAEFNGWIRRSPEHVRAYLEMAAAWEESARLDRRGELDPQTLLAQALQESNVVSLAGAANKKRFVVRSSGRLRQVGIAAAVAIAIGGLAAWFILQRNVYSTDIGEQRSIVLADGSTIELNSASKLRVDFSDSARAVSLLQGQALFNVAKDARRAFIVHSGPTEVRVVGTRFDVYRKKSATTVTVLQGRVAVSTMASDEAAAGSAKGLASAPVMLAAGEQITLTSVQRVARPVRAEVNNVVAWTQRKLVFDEVPLADAIEEFNRYNVRRLVIEDPTLNGFHVRGTFSATEPERLAQFLGQRFDVTVSQTNREIRISRNQK